MQPVAEMLKTEMRDSEIESEMDALLDSYPALSGEALARRRALLQADVEAYYAGTLETYSPEEFEKIMDDFEEKLEEKYARSQKQAL